MNTTGAKGQRHKGTKGKHVCVILCTIVSMLVLAGCAEKEQMYRESRVLMDTFCSITVVAPSQEKATEAINAGFAEIKKLETLLNFFSDKSEISDINHAAGIRAVTVSDETLDIMKKTFEISLTTGGAFDPAIAPVIRLWNFSDNARERTVPPEDLVKKTLKLVDFSKIRINIGTSEIMLETRGMELDLGGIAKGYAADKAVEAIQAQGVQAALVAIAGDIRGFGQSTSGRPWKVGIQNPRPESATEKPWEDVFATLYLEDGAISTSGDYQRFFMKDGIRYHHILDPKTGFPSRSELISVSVIAPQGYLSDSLSTAVFVLGAKKGLTILEAMGIDGVLVNHDKEVYITPGLKGKIDILNSEYSLIERMRT